MLGTKKKWSLNEWINNFLLDDHPYYHDEDHEDKLTLPHDPMPGGDEDHFYDEEFDEGILETMIILSLAAALLCLVLYRRQRQAEHRRNEEAMRARQAGQPLPADPVALGDGGLFPQPGDPAFAQWVAGGIGH